VAVTALTADSTAAAEQVQCPALVATGELDMTCPVPAGESMAKTLNTDLVILAGRGHVVSMEDPDAVAQLIADHVARNDT
jgi:pimeloyl-ACP methyl ester carboxylesterase